MSHGNACDCAPCRVDIADRMSRAHQEELAGREHLVSVVSRPVFWRPRPGTAKAIARTYPEPKRRAS